LSIPKLIEKTFPANFGSPAASTIIPLLLFAKFFQTICFVFIHTKHIKSNKANNNSTITSINHKENRVDKTSLTLYLKVTYANSNLAVIKSPSSPESGYSGGVP
jgi:hypothetical protein